MPIGYSAGMYKELFSAAAILVTFVAFLPYIRSILHGATRPHLFSWLIWGSTTFVVFLAQLADKGGLGAWPTGVSGMITMVVALLAFRHKSDNSITGADWFFFLSAISSLPLWYLTDDPLWAVLILTGVDLLGFGPTIRKAYVTPYEEKLTFFALFVVRNALAIAALEHYSFTTVLFPAATGIACLLLILVATFRRQAFDR